MRIALGTLIIQEKLGTSDVETVEQIAKNPYLQYFLSYHEYIEKLPFDSSTIVHFRKRLGKDIAGKINEEICKLNKKAKSCKIKRMMITINPPATKEYSKLMQPVLQQMLNIQRI